MQEALHFLSHSVSEMVNHDDEEESKAFRALTLWLFKWKNGILGQIREPCLSTGFQADSMHDQQGNLLNIIF